MTLHFVLGYCSNSLNPFGYEQQHALPSAWAGLEVQGKANQSTESRVNTGLKSSTPGLMTEEFCWEPPTFQMAFLFSRENNTCYLVLSKAGATSVSVLVGSVFLKPQYH